MKNERELKMLIIDNAEKIAKILHRRNDVEITTSSLGIEIREVKKTKV